MSEANNDIAIQFKLQRDMAWAELARVTKERNEATAEAETTKAFYADTDKQRRDGISELAALKQERDALAADMVQMAIRHAHEIDSLSTENTELRAVDGRFSCQGLLDNSGRSLDERRIEQAWFASQPADLRTVALTILTELHTQLAAMKAENAELRADLERLTKLLSDCLGILEIALMAHPGGAFLNAVCEEDLPRFRAAIDAAREGQKSADDTQGGAL